MLTKTWILAIGAALALTGCERKNSDEPFTAPLVQDQQPNLTMTERIRQSVHADPSMSPAARNITLVLDDGVITLRGPIATEQEAATVEQIALGIAGEGNVRNQLEVIDASGGAVLTTPNRVGDLQTAPVTPPTPVDPAAQPAPTPTPTAPATTIVVVPMPAWASPPTTVASGTGAVVDDPATGVAPGTAAGSAHPGLTAPGEVPQFTPGTIGITPGTTAPAPSGISPGTTTTTPSNPRAQPQPSTQPGIQQPVPVPPGSTVSPNNPGMNTPSTTNPPSMGPGTGNTPISPPPSAPPPSSSGSPR
jgi:hypothetical protein